MPTIDKEFEIPVYSKICTTCKNLIDGTTRQCRAFDEIPLPIWNGEIDHNSAYKGDKGIKFEPIE